MKKQNCKKYFSERVYAEGFGPDHKLAKFFKTPVPPKTAGIASLLISAGLVVFLSVFIFPSFFQGPHINQTAFIKNSQTHTIKTVSIVAGGQPVAWTTLVRRSDITSGKYLLNLPKGAANIKIQTITQEQAKAVLLAEPKEQLSLAQRAQLAAKSGASSNIFAKAQNFLFADLEMIVSNTIDIITQPSNPDITQTSDSTIVDLSAQAPTPTPEITPEESPTPDLIETVSLSDQPVVVESPAPTETPTPAPETPAPVETPAQAEPTPTQQTVDTSILTDDIVSAQALYANAVVGINPGDYAQTDKDTLQSAINSATVVENNQSSTQADIDNADAILNTAIATFMTSSQSQFVKIDYETPSPTITEQNTDTGKLVTVSAPGENPNNPLTNVLAFTKIPRLFKVGQESKIHINWKNNSDQDVALHAYDTDKDGYLDYVEWTVPHLSDQVFEIIFISKAFQLDSDQNIVADIYDQVKTKNNIWAQLTDGQYVRYTFEQPLDNTRDNTIYAKPTNPSQPVTINVYPVYTDQDGNTTEGSLVATFPAIDHEGTYKIMLTNLQTPTDVFDMKITGNVDIDYIVDPTPANPPSVTEPANSSSAGYLQSTIIGTPNAATQTTNNLFDYLRKLEYDKLNITNTGVSEPATTDAGKLQDLLGTYTGSAVKSTIFNYIYALYANLANLLATNIKSGIIIGGITGTYTSGTGLNLKTGQTSCYNNAGTAVDCGTTTGQDANYSKGLVLAYKDNGDGTVTDNNTNLMWIKQPELIVPNSVTVLDRGAWATSTAYALNDMVKAVQYATGTASRSGYTVTVAGGGSLDTSCVGRELFIGGVSQGIIKVRGSSTSVTVSETGTTASGALTVQSYYKCITAHTSGTFLTDLASVYWKERPSRITVAGSDWAAPTAYAMGTVVRDATGSTSTPMAITSLTAGTTTTINLTSPATVTSGQSVLISGFDGTVGTTLNGNIYYVIVNVTAQTLTLYTDAACGTLKSTAGNTYTVAGTATQTKFYVSAVATTSTGNGTLALDIAANPTWWVETVWTASAANLTTPSTMAWFPTGGLSDSINNCENLTYAGYSDWRLPNIKELFGIVVEEAGAVSGVKASGAPYTNQTVFTNPVSYYWSSTTSPNSATYALYVSFSNGYASNYYKTSPYYVRCVRGQ